MSDSIFPAYGKHDLIRETHSRFLILRDHIEEIQKENENVRMGYFIETFQDAYHYLACLILDPHLRDNPTIYDQTGKTYHFRGCEISGLRICTPCEKYCFLLKVLHVTNDGFIAQKELSSPERFTYRWKTS